MTIFTTELERAEAAVENHARALNDYDSPTQSDGTYPDLDKEGVIEVLNLFRERLRFVEHENAVLKLERMKLKNDASWTRNPDRSGGQFTQQEIDEANRGGHGW